MNKKVLGVVGTLFSLAALGIFVLIKMTDVSEDTRLKKEKTLEQNRTALKVAIGEFESAEREGSKEIKANKLDGLSELLDSKTSLILRMSDHYMVDLELYGRVVDQFGEPVSGATVKAGYNGTGMFQGKGNNLVLTGNNGEFYLEGKGQEIYILSISHPDISRFLTLSGNLDKHSPSKYFAARYFNNPNRKGKTSEDPYTLIVNKVESYEKIVFHGGRNSHPFIVVENNQLSIEKYHLKFECIREYVGSVPNQVGSWKARLSPIGVGGFQRVDTLYMDEAPDAGYNIPYIEVGYDFGDPDWRNQVTFGNFRHPDDLYYYKSMGGEVHGVFKLSFMDPTLSRFSCMNRFQFIKYNENGSTNVAIPPNQETWHY